MITCENAHEADPGMFKNYNAAHASIYLMVELSAKNNWKTTTSGSIKSGHCNFGKSLFTTLLPAKCEIIHIKKFKNFLVILMP